MGREVKAPAQIFWHIGVKKKWYKLSKLGGGGMEVIWTKSKRTATSFRETFPMTIPTNKQLQRRICCYSLTHHIIKNKDENKKTNTRQSSIL